MNLLKVPESIKQYSNSIKHLSAKDCKDKNIDEEKETADMSDFQLRSKSRIFYEDSKEEKNIFISEVTGSQNPEDDIDDLLSSDEEKGHNVPANHSFNLTI